MVDSSVGAPARGPHGSFRFDSWEITPVLTNGRNLLTIEVADYNVNSYYVLNQPSFLQAGVVTDSAVLASTGGDGDQFRATVLSKRVQKVQRYSFQRASPRCIRWIRISTNGVKTWMPKS